jgi:hypothetical protein
VRAPVDVDEWVRRRGRLFESGVGRIEREPGRVSGGAARGRDSDPGRKPNREGEFDE